MRIRDIIPVRSPKVIEGMKAQRRKAPGVDAVVRDCMVDPVLRAARETVNIPVLAPGQSGLTVASLLGARIAVIGMKNGQQVLEEHLRAYGFSHRVCSMHVVDAPPADLIESQPYCLDIINREIDAAIAQHRAEVILFGCTAMSGYIDDLKAKYRLPIVET